MRNFLLRLSVSCCALALCVVLHGAVGSAKAQEPAGSEAIVLLLNKAKILQLPASAVTIVVGNPSVADVTMLRRSRQMILTGKGFGETNLIALDSQGRSVGESLIRVTNSSRGLVVQRGMDRETWDCSPRCQPTFSLGDANKFASENAAQIQARNASVGAGGRPAGGGGGGGY
ncbi:MAG: pilus assembly protein N-terminal domain-containing protein [Beijerinckiaceae bacterium]|nr:pilus assembly protein N-terminal domain-containing protein [Beijerinckiaceae bacterium]